MLDIQFIRENTDKVKKGVSDKQFDPKLVDRVLDVDGKRRKLIVEVEELRAKRNKVSEEKNIEEGKKIKEELKAKEPQLTKIEEEYNEIINQIPNLPLDATPIGKSEKDNVEVRKWGEPKKFDFTPKDHLELGKSLGILDFEAGAKVAGSQFYFWYREGAALELALVQYAMELLSKEGFIPVITPDLAKSRYYLGTGYMPKGNEAQTYEIKDEDLGLIATAEVTLAGKHADEVIRKGDLPLKYVGYSHCFRQEAGAYGKYSKGLYRVHQFTKVEMFTYTAPEDSPSMHEKLLELEEKLWQGLGIPYRVVEMCTGDLGFPAAKKYDIEAWMPSQNKYREVTSTSNTTDFQARRLNIKIKKNGKSEYLHTLNGTVLALGRAMIAIYENFQQEDGSIVIPAVLHKWMGKKIIKLRKS